MNSFDVKLFSRTNFVAFVFCFCCARLVRRAEGGVPWRRRGQGEVRGRQREAGPGPWANGTVAGAARATGGGVKADPGREGTENN